MATRGREAVVTVVVVVFSLTFLIRSVQPVPGILVAYGRYVATVLGQAGDIIYSGEGLNSSVAVSRLPSGRLGYHNAGKIQASSEPRGHAAAAHARPSHDARAEESEARWS